jgi:serine phosphatase RsbU (regulator of sigma subunit)
MKKNIGFIFLYLLTFTAIGYSQNKDRLFITADSLASTEFFLGRWDKADWYYKSGDNPSWALAEYNHSNWDTVASWLEIGKFDQSKWKGVAWLRIVFKIDSSLKGKAVGFKMHHDGASEIYLNGKKILTFGKFGKNADEEKPYDPNFFPTIISLDTSSVYTLAVRISNKYAEKHEYFYNKFIGHIGFSINLFDINTQSKKILESHYKTFSFDWGVQGFSLAFAVIFILLYFFYSKKKENLYFALFVFGIFLIFTAGTIEYIFKSSFYVVVFARFLSFISFTIIFINLLLFIYQIVYKKVIKLFWFFLIVFLIINLIIFFSFDQLTSYNIPMLIGVAILGIETVRVIVIGIRKKIPNIRIIASGIIVSLTVIIFFVTVYLSELYFEWLINSADYLAPILILSIPFSMAIYLAKSFAKTNKELEERIVTIQEMSEKQIEQERKNSELQLEAERERIESERKSEELEAARQIQISMLPTELPNLPNLDIAVYMRTATEVGGDYYDFRVGKDGVLNIALGDATGHGLQAGTLVTIMKGIFTLESENNGVLSFFEKSVKALKEIKLGRLMMAFAFLKIRGNQLSLSNAGVPPVYIYRHNNNEVEEIDNKGMPLGAMNNFPYKETKTELNSGDVIFVLSDGFPELQSNEKESFGYERVIKTFKETGERSAEAIIEHLRNTVNEWSGVNVPDDDVTFVVIKVK